MSGESIKRNRSTKPLVGLQPGDQGGKSSETKAGKAQESTSEEQRPDQPIPLEDDAMMVAYT